MGVILLHTMLILEDMPTVILSANFLSCVCEVCVTQLAANSIQICLFVSRPVSAACTDGCGCHFWKAKAPSLYGCNQLAALCFKYVDIFTLNKIISTSYNNSVSYEGVLYMEPVLRWHAWERQMVAVQFPFSLKKKKRENIRLAIDYVAAAQSNRFGLRGNKRLSFGEICLLALSWLLCKDLLFCCKDTRGLRATDPPPLPSAQRAAW